MTERAALLALLRDAKRWAAVTESVEERGSALEVLRENHGAQLLLLDGAGPASDGDLGISARESEIREWEREGMRFVTILDADYPPQLLGIHQRPPFVMWRGRPLATDSSGVAIVGTRRASPSGLARARTLAHGLAERGVTIVSGLAEGIDTAAHLSALEAHGRTVAVIGTGLRRAYPHENTGLQERIAHEGLVLSQFLPDAPPTRTSFPMRNAVMSGYAAATVVVEASWKSGARMQARLALEHGRTLFLLESLLEHDWAREYASRPGAIVVDTVDDVERQLARATQQAAELVWA